jgi:hypothetical protein
MITAEKREKWLRHLEAWKVSGLSANKYCIENGINKNSFRYWIDRDKKKATKNQSFIKLRIPKKLPANESNEFSLRYGSFKIMIPSSFDKSDLNRILDILQARVL